MIKVRIWRWGDYSGLSGWVPNANTGLLLRDRQRFDTHRGGGDVTPEAETGMMPPRAKECQQTPEAGRERQGADSPLEPLEGAQPC